MKLTGHAFHKYIYVPIASGAFFVWTNLKKYILVPTYNGVAYVSSAVWNGLVYLATTLWDWFAFLMKSLWRGVTYCWECFTTLCSLIYRSIWLPLWNGIVWAWFEFVDGVVYVCRLMFKFLYWAIYYPIKWVVTKLYHHLAIPLYNASVYLKSAGYQYLALPVYNWIVYFIVQPATWLAERCYNLIAFIAAVCYNFIAFIAATGYNVIVLALIYPVFKFVSDVVESVLNAFARLFKAISKVFGV